MAAELLIIAIWVGVWIVVSLFLTVIMKIYHLLIPKQKYVEYPKFFKQWLKILLVVPLFMP